MPEFILKNNFEFDSNVKHQMSGTATGTKISPPYGCIYMDYMENQVIVVVVALLNENMADQQLAKELHKPIIRKLKKMKNTLTFHRQYLGYRSSRCAINKQI